MRGFVPCVGLKHSHPVAISDWNGIIPFGWSAADPGPLPQGRRPEVSPAAVWDSLHVSAKKFGTGYEAFLLNEVAVDEAASRCGASP
jgi:hypothetical protein